jgi:translation initiation factor IF-3
MGKLIDEGSNMKFEIQSLKKVEKTMKVKVMVLFNGRRRVFEQKGFHLCYSYV